MGRTGGLAPPATTSAAAGGLHALHDGRALPRRMAALACPGLPSTLTLHPHAVASCRASYAAEANCRLCTVHQTVHVFGEDVVLGHHQRPAQRHAACVRALEEQEPGYTAPPAQGPTLHYWRCVCWTLQPLCAHPTRHTKPWQQQQQPLFAALPIITGSSTRSTGMTGGGGQPNGAPPADGAAAAGHHNGGHIRELIPGEHSGTAAPPSGSVWRFGRGRGLLLLPTTPTRSLPPSLPHSLVVPCRLPPHRGGLQVCQARVPHAGQQPLHYRPGADGRRAAGKRQPPCCCFKLIEWFFWVGGGEALTTRCNSSPPAPHGFPPPPPQLELANMQKQGELTRLYTVAKQTDLTFDLVSGRGLLVTLRASRTRSHHQCAAAPPLGLLLYRT